MGILTQLGLLVLLLVSPVAPGALDRTPAPQPQGQTVATASVAPYPVKKTEAVEPVIRAKSALLVDLPSGTTLYAKDPDARLPIASITKLMSALLVVEKTKPDAVVTVPKLQNRPEESLMGLREGDQLRIEDLLAGSLIASGNDATSVLAQAVAGSEGKFVDLMNQRAKQLGMDDTHFDNSTGYGTGENVSTARNLVILSRAALAQERIRQLVGLQEKTVSALNAPAPNPDNPAPTGPTQYQLRTTDQLLGGYLPVAGLKTGTSDAAGPSVISELVSGPRQLLAIVLNSPDRFQENKSMLDWALNSYRW